MEKEKSTLLHEMRQTDIPGLPDRAAFGDMARQAVWKEGGRVIGSKTAIYWFATKNEAMKFQRSRDKKKKRSKVIPAGNYKGRGVDRENRRV